MDRWADETKKKTSRVTAFAEKRSEGRVTYKDRQDAVILTANPRILLSKLRDKVFADACRRRGINVKDLLPRDISEFAHFNGRAAPLSLEEQEFRYQEFEKERMHLLGLALSQERIHQAEILAHEESRKKQMGKFRSALNRRLGAEQKYIEKKNRNRLKEENCLMRQNKSVQLQAEKARSSRFNLLDNTRQQVVLKSNTFSGLRIKQSNQARQRKVAKNREEKARKEQALREFRRERLRKKTERATNCVQKARRETSAQKMIATRDRLDHIRREAREKATHRMEDIRLKLDAKQRNAEQSRKKAKERAHMENMRRQIKNQMRRARAARIRSAIEYDCQRMQQDQLSKDDRVDALAELGITMNNRRAKMGRANSEEAAMWRRKKFSKRALGSPGPGEYAMPGGNDAHHAVPWGEHEKPPSVFDISARRAAEVPGPGDYTLHSSIDAVRGGEWGTSPKPMSELDWAIKRSRELPSPGSYDPLLPKSVAGVSMEGDGKKSFIDDISRQAVLQDIPSPGHRNNLALDKPRTVEELRTSFRGAVNAANIVGHFSRKLRTLRENTTSKAKTETKQD